MKKYNVEDLHKEIIESIVTYFANDEDTLIQCLRYLYYNTEDDLLKKEVIENISERNYCIECGTKLITYTWDEIHTELEYNNREPMFAEYCPYCDEYEITSDMKEVD
jgi:hypothetical protein